jgi:hypothetical protein
MEHQAFHILGEVDEGDLGLDTFDADGANEQPHIPMNGQIVLRQPLPKQ